MPAMTAAGQQLCYHHSPVCHVSKQQLHFDKNKRMHHFSQLGQMSDSKSLPMLAD